jgi:proton-coupled amino acid transporter
MLALPLAFNKAGYGVGSVFLIAIAIITVHCMLLLVASGQALSRRLKIQALEYGQVTQMAFLNLKWKNINFGCCRVRSSTFGFISKIVVNIFLAITQFGFSTVYFVFVASTLQYLVKNIPYIEYEIDIRFWIIIVLVPFALITYIRDLRTLAPFVAVANVCLLFVVLVILIDAVYRFATKRAAVNCEQKDFNITVDPSHAMVCGINPWPLSLNDLFIFFGVAVYTFEGIGFVMPLENKVTKPQYFKPVLIAGMTTVATVYFVMGMVGYFAYGKCSNANLTFDLQSDNVWWKSLYHITQLYIAFTIYMSHALQFYVPMDFIEPPILLKLGLFETEGNRRKEMLKFLTQISIRTPIVAIMCGVALITPNNLSDYISLVGAMASSALAFIFPPLLHIMVFACASPKMDLSDESLSRHAELNDKKVDMHTTPLQCTYKALWIGKDAAIFVFGIVGAVFGTYSTIQEIVNTFNGVPINKQCQGA